MQAHWERRVFGTTSLPWLGTLLYLQKLSYREAETQDYCRLLLLRVGDCAVRNRQFGPHHLLFLQTSQSCILHRTWDCFYSSVFSWHYPQNHIWRNRSVLCKLLQYRRRDHPHSLSHTSLPQAGFLDHAQNYPVDSNTEGNFELIQLFRIARLLAKYDKFRKGVLQSTYGRKIKILFTQLYVAAVVGLRIFPVYCTVFYVFGIIGMEFLSFNQCGITDE